MLDNPPIDKIWLKLSKVMKLYKFIIYSAIISASIVAASLPVRALQPDPSAIVTYTDRNAFLAALSSSSIDNYNDLTTAFRPSAL